MGVYLDAAFRILTEDGRPLRSDVIAERALAQGLIRSRGKTPAQTMKSKLSTDILTRREKSLFMRTGPGEFGLRSWSGARKEFSAPRFQRALLDEAILAISRDDLHRFVPGPGFFHTPLSGGRRLAALASPIQRRQAEERWDIVQLVSGFVVHCQGNVLTYRRSRRLPEARLHGSYSVFFGGHLNPGDIPALFDIFAPDPDVGFTYLARELNEELVVGQRPAVYFKGLLYDVSRAVSEQHLGIFYDVVLAGTDYDIGERGFLMDSRFEAPNAICGRRDEFENWSQVLIDSGLLARQE